MSSRRASPLMDKEYHPASPKCQSERAAVTPISGAADAADRLVDDPVAGCARTAPPTAAAFAPIAISRKRISRKRMRQPVRQVPRFSRARENRRELVNGAPSGGRPRSGCCARRPRSSRRSTPPTSPHQRRRHRRPIRHSRKRKRRRRLAAAHQRVDLLTDRVHVVAARGAANG